MKQLLKQVTNPLWICFFACASSSAQPIALLDNYKHLPQELQRYAVKGQTANYNKASAAQLLNLKPAAFSFIFSFEGREWEIELTRSDIYSRGFFVTTGSHPNGKFNYPYNALHYNGHIKDKPGSFAAISILPDNLVAVIADDGGNINIGAVNTPEARLKNGHIIYRDADLLIRNGFACGTAGAPGQEVNPLPTYPNSTNGLTVNTEPVDMYFEADFATYNNNGASVTNTVNYVTALFNVVYTIYERDSVLTKISAIKVWNVADPYTAIGTTSPLLTAFSNNMANGFPGDLAHFLSQRSLGGGIAYVNVLCSGNSVKTAVSGNLSNSFNVFPVYSWSAMVITHESGHNIGSPHTQSCSWAGGAIDNCYTTEGGCPPGPAPVNGGTIMSYCHLTGYGINLANGFGPQPGALIRSRVRNNTCINPGVYFETTAQIVTEESADVDNGCLDYKLITTRLKIPYAPSQPAGITLVPAGGAGLLVGTNQDVEITGPLSFVLDSANLSRTIEMRVYNDAVVENPETLTLNFNLNANGGNAIKRNSSVTHTATVTSADHRPDSTVNQLLYYENFDAISGGTGPWTATVLYGAGSPNRWVIGNSGDPAFPSQALYVSNNGGTLAYSGSTAADSATLRIASPTINAALFTNMQLSLSAKCNGEFVFVNGGGTSGGLTALDFGRITYSVDNGANWLLLRDNIFGRNTRYIEAITLPANANNSSQLRIAFEWRNNSSVVNNPPLIIDSVIITGAGHAAIQTAAHAANIEEEYLGPNQTVHYYNPVTKNIMATIENTSAFDFGCTKVELIRTGNGAVNAWGTLAAERISEKVFKVTPTNANAAAPFKLSFYMTDAEINGWLNATGNTAAEMRIVKTDADITQVPPASPAVFSSVNTATAYAGNPQSRLTAAFNGFSYFAVSKPIAAPACPATNLFYASGIAGSAYQWQVNTGGGFTDIANGAIYTGAAADTLRLAQPPTSWYGYTYRCAVTTPLGIIYTQMFTLKFGLTWLGGVSADWANPLNWGCNVLPDANTDVLIKAGVPFTPQVNASTAIRSLQLQTGANVVVASGVQLTIAK